MGADEAARGRPGERERLEGVVSDRNGPQHHGLRPDRMADGGQRAKDGDPHNDQQGQTRDPASPSSPPAPLATAQGFAPGAAGRALTANIAGLKVEDLAARDAPAWEAR
jgi:hypothetical protein